MARLVDAPPVESLRPAARIRVIYGDTDRMGFVYHATYLRFLEHARVEFMRDLGLRYIEMEAAGFGLPVVDLAITYRAPALYDDVVTVHVGMEKLSYVRLNFIYRITVEPHDRAGLTERFTVLEARTLHGCTSLEDGRATRFPDHIWEVLDSARQGAQETPG